MRRLFEAFMTKLFKYLSLENYTILNLKQFWIFILLDYNLFSSKWLYFIALLLSSLPKTSAIRSSVVTAENFAGTTSLISLYLFPVT